jgi:hypothetical protein
MTRTELRRAPDHAKVTGRELAPTPAPAVPRESQPPFELRTDGLARLNGEAADKVTAFLGGEWAPDFDTDSWVGAGVATHGDGVQWQPIGRERQQYFAGGDESEHGSCAELRAAHGIGRAALEGNVDERPHGAFGLSRSKYATAANG